MENLTFVVYGMNGGFFDEILFSYPYYGMTVQEWNDYLAMMCGL